MTGSEPRRVLVTRNLPGEQWQTILESAGCSADILERGSEDVDMIDRALERGCQAVIGQLTERWDAERLAALAQAGGVVYCNYAVGYDNVDVEAATRLGLLVANTPGVLTRTTAELAVGLTLAASRRLVEADEFVRSGRFTGWEPDLLLGTQLFGRKLGVVGAGRIGSAYSLMMVRGFGVDLVYHSRSRKPELEDQVTAFAAAEAAAGRRAPSCRFEPDVDRLLKEADIVSLHTSLASSTRHLVGADRLAAMKPDAVLVNVSRGPVVDETALVEHCRSHPDFRVGLDVFEDEPMLAPGLSELPNAVLAPHIGSASTWTRRSMSVLAARNVVGALNRFPLWDRPDYEALLAPDAPNVTPSIVNPAAANWITAG